MCRGEKTAIELFIACVQGWEARLWQQIENCKFTSDYVGLCFRRL
jgi:hypothetical protein